MSASKPKPELSVRSANEQDLPALTTLTISSFVTDPQWSYRLSYRDQFPEDHFKYSMDRLDGFLSQVPRGCAAYMVAEAEESAGKRIVGAATWQLPGSHLEGENQMQYRPFPNHRRDMIRARNDAFFNAVHDAKDEHFDKRFGERQLYLSALCVEPAYQGCGIGTTLLQWGIDKARSENVGITLFASPTGRNLYAKMGFKDAVWSKAQVAGEEEFVEFPGMYWVANEGDFPIKSA